MMDSATQMLRRGWTSLRGNEPDDAVRPAPRVKTPTVLQMEAVECGAASLAIILAHYGRIVPLEDVRAACGVNRDGSKASNMLKAARSYGLVAKGYKRTPEALRTMEGPMIVHWNFNHFLVLEGFKGDIVYLNDPATGPRTVTFEEFDEAFTGVVLTFEAGPEFEPGGSRRTLWAALGRRLEGSGRAVAYILLAGLALVVPSLVVPTYSKIFVDEILIGGGQSWLRPLLLAMGTTAVVMGLLAWFQFSTLLRLETKLASSTSGQFFWHVLRLPFQFFTQRYGGEVGSRVAINDKVARVLSQELATSMISGLMVVFYAALMIQYDVVLTLVGVVIAGLNIVTLRFVSRRRKDANQRMLQENGKLMGVAMGGLQTIETLKASGTESDFFTRWAGHHAKSVNAKQRLGLSTQVLNVVPPFLLSINVTVILGLGAIRVMNGEMSMGMLVAFQALMLSFIGPVNTLVSMGGEYQETEGDMNRLDDVLNYDIDETHQAAIEGDRPAESARHPSRGDGATVDAPSVSVPSSTDHPSPDHSSPDHSSPDLLSTDASDAAGEPGATGESAEAHPPGPAGGALLDEAGHVPAGTTLPAKLEGSLEMRDVSFGFNKLEDPFIEGLNLKLEPGMRVALVGGSGSGKSTVARLVCGLFRPWSGEILFDGIPREEVPLDVLNNSFAVVDQEIFLFQGSIQDNLTLWDDTVPEADVVEASKDACIHDVIAERPRGYASDIEEGGGNFSGGQCQRLEIARALAGRPSIMVLDEATSALDAATEKIIDDNLRRRGCTCLIVAHRLSTIRDCDEILVLDQGRVVQRGTHDGMLEEGGPYARLIKEY